MTLCSSLKFASCAISGSLSDVLASWCFCLSRILTLLVRLMPWFQIQKCCVSSMKSSVVLTSASLLSRWDACWAVLLNSPGLPVVQEWRLLEGWQWARNRCVGSEMWTMHESSCSLAVVHNSHNSLFELQIILSLHKVLAGSNWFVELCEFPVYGTWRCWTACFPSCSCFVVLRIGFTILSSSRWTTERSWMASSKYAVYQRRSSGEPVPVLISWTRLVLR